MYLECTWKSLFGVFGVVWGLSRCLGWQPRQYVPEWPLFWPLLARCCCTSEPLARPDFPTLRLAVKNLNDINIMRLVLESMMVRMEQYANNLESLVTERTEDYFCEKKKTEDLLYELLPKWVTQTSTDLLNSETFVLDQFAPNSSQARQLLRILSVQRPFTSGTSKLQPPQDHNIKALIDILL